MTNDELVALYQGALAAQKRADEAMKVYREAYDGYWRNRLGLDDPDPPRLAGRQTFEVEGVRRASLHEDPLMLPVCYGVVIKKDGTKGELRRDYLRPKPRR